MRQILTSTIDAKPLAMARIAVGIASAAFALEWLGPLLKVASGGYLVMPVFDGAPSLPAPAVWALFALSIAGSVGMIFGAAGRVPALVVAACAALVLLVDQQTYSNHLLLTMMLSAFVGLSGASKALTLSGPKRTERVPYWPAFLIKAQISTLYAWTAVAKINPQYLSGEVIGANLRPWVPAPEELLPAVSLMSVLAELFLAVALWLPRIRLLAFLVGAGLHLGILVALLNPAPLIPFAMLMLSGYILFAHDSIERGHWTILSPRVRKRATRAAGYP